MHLTARLTGTILLCAVLFPSSGMAQTTPAPAQPQVQAKSGWTQLSALERQALAPLATLWGEISEGQRSKWRTIAKHFDQISVADQQIMQTRMREWAALSPVQRNQARLNFNTVQSVSKDQKKTLWDEYQSLSEEEKRKLSAGVPTAAKTMAPSPKPTAPDRLVQPTLRTVPAAALPARTPIDQKTLLPMPAAHAPDAPASESAPSPESSSL